MKKQKGSVVIEMTLIIPMLLLIVYLYIMLFLSFIYQSKEIHKLVEVLYEEEETTNLQGYRENIVGECRSLCYEDNNEIYPFSLQWKCYENNSVELIRRWQVAANIVP